MTELSQKDKDYLLPISLGVAGVTLIAVCIYFIVRKKKSDGLSHIMNTGDDSMPA